MTGRFLTGLLAVAAALSLSTAAAQPPPGWFDPTTVDDAPVAAPVKTAHEGIFNGTPIRYQAIAGEFLLSGEQGEPAATMFSTAYLRTDAGSAARPVMFVFNGGPGASSSPLHLGIGPFTRPADDPQGSLVPNPASPLDAVDLVFIDPVGTGYTRLFREDAGEAFWGIEADAGSVLALIRDWLQRHGRESSPVYVMGESYGGTRAIVVAARAERARIDGVLLISPAIDFSASAQVVGNNLPYLSLLPSMAAAAAHHGAVDTGGWTITAVFEDAAAYALTDYAAALYQGNAIDPADRARTANRLARLTGLDEGYVLEHNLRIDGAEFQDRLLAADGLRIGKLDARASGPVGDYRDRRPPGDDPSMSGRNPDARGTGELLDEYYSDRLGVRVPRPYRTLNLDLNRKWDYGHRDGLKTYFTVAPELQAAMQANPALRVFIGGGVFDVGTPIMAARHTASQIDTDPERFVFRGYEAGHTVTDDPGSREAMSRDVRDFVAGISRE